MIMGQVAATCRQTTTERAGARGGKAGSGPARAEAKADAAEARADAKAEAAEAKADAKTKAAAKA